MDISLGSCCLREIDGIPCELLPCVFLANCHMQHILMLLSSSFIRPFAYSATEITFWNPEPQKWISPLINHEFLLGNLRDIVLTFFFEFRLLRSLFSASGEGYAVQGLERVWRRFWRKPQGPVLGLPWLVGSHMVGCCHFPGCKDGILQAILKPVGNRCYRR